MGQLRCAGARVFIAVLLAGDLQKILATPGWPPGPVRPHRSHADLAAEPPCKIRLSFAKYRKAPCPDIAQPCVRVERRTFPSRSAPPARVWHGDQPSPVNLSRSEKEQAMN